MEVKLAAKGSKLLAITAAIEMRLRKKGKTRICYGLSKNLSCGEPLEEIRQTKPKVVNVGQHFFMNTKCCDFFI